MTIKYSMLDVNRKTINKGDTILVGAGGLFDRYIFRWFDTETKLTFIQDYNIRNKSPDIFQALPQLIYKEGL